MSDTKKELNDNELERASGGVAITGYCENFEANSSSHGFKCCQFCTHFTRTGPILGKCDYEINRYKGITSI